MRRVFSIVEGLCVACLGLAASVAASCGTHQDGVLRAAAQGDVRGALVAYDSNARNDNALLRQLALTWLCHEASSVSSSEPQIHAEAVRALVALGSRGKACLERLVPEVSASTLGDAQAREAAVRKLIDAPVDRLWCADASDMARRDPLAAVRALSVRAAWKHCVDRVQLVERALQDVDASVRRAAWAAMLAGPGELAAEWRMRVDAALAEDIRTETLEIAQLVLSIASDEGMRGKAQAVVERALGAADPRLRAEAVVVLGASAPNANVRVLLMRRWALEAVPWVRSPLAHVLGPTDAAVRAWLTQSMHASNPDGVEAALELALVGDAAARAQLLIHFKAKDARVRVVAARALGRLSGTLSALKQGLLDAGLSVRMAAAVSIVSAPEGES